MKKYLLFISILVSICSFAQTPSGTKTRYPGIWLSSKDTATNRTTADSIQIIANRADSSLRFYWSVGAPSRKIALGSDLSLKLNISDTAKYIPFTTPEAYGYISGDATSYIQNAVNSMLPVYLKKMYPITTTITIPNGGAIIGGGDTTGLTLSTDISAITIGGNNIKLSSFRIYGNGISGASVGVYYLGNITLTLSKSDVVIDKITFENLNKGFYYTQNVGVYHQGVRLSDCLAKGNYYGFYNDTRGEYSYYNNCVAYNNTVGWYNKAGNNFWTGGGINNNTTGIHIPYGENDSHSSISNAAINHNTRYAVLIDSAQLGFDINGCSIYYGTIYFKNTKLAKLNGNQLGTLDSLLLGNALNTDIQNNKFIDSFYISTSYTTASTVRWMNNRWNGHVVTPYQNTMEGSLVVGGNVSNGALDVRTSNGTLGQWTLGNSTGTRHWAAYQQTTSAGGQGDFVSAYDYVSGKDVSTVLKTTNRTKVNYSANVAAIYGNFGIGLSDSATYKMHLKQSALNNGFGIESNSDDAVLLQQLESAGWVIKATYNTTGAYKPIILKTSDQTAVTIATTQDVTFEKSITSKKIIGGSSSPSVTLGANITGSVAVTGTDMAGTVTVSVTSASSLATLNDLFTLTYNSTYSSTPHVVWSISSSQAGTLQASAGGLYLKNSGPGSFQIATVGSYTTPTIATYSFTYHVIQ